MRRLATKLGLLLVVTAAISLGGAGAADKPLPEVVPAGVDAVRAAINKPGATAVLVNVWATWCEPCREEMPDILRFHRARKGQGLRLVLISADDEEDREKVARYLASQGVDFPTWLKQGDDMAFINGLERKWSGALPASFLYDGGGRLRELWPGPVTYKELDRAFIETVNAASKSKPTRRTP